MDTPTIFFIAGVVILTASMFVQIRKHYRREAEQTAKRRAAVRAAREAELKRQQQTGEPVKIKTGPHRSDPSMVRIPMSETFEKPFNGGATPKAIAQWETEIHQIGRQIIGQIDSKMVALQTLNLEANRAANRLELLVEHLEHLSSVHAKKGENRANSGTTGSFSDLKSATNPVESPSVEPAIEKEDRALFGETMPAEKTNLISGGDPSIHSVQVETFSDVLNELESELDQFHQEVETLSSLEPIVSATILKAEESLPVSPVPSATKPLTQRISSNIALSTGNPLVSDSKELNLEPIYKNSSGTTKGSASMVAERSPFSLSSPQMPGISFQTPSATLPHSMARPPASPRPTISNVSAIGNGSHRITVSSSKNGSASNDSGTMDNTSSMGLSLDSLYETDLVRPDAEESKPLPPLPASLIGSRLEVRKQVEMMSDYGYSAHQIAQNLGITSGEVDLILSLRS